jgi:hypothetical protein
LHNAVQARILLENLGLERITQDIDGTCCLRVVQDDLVDRAQPDDRRITNPFGQRDQEAASAMLAFQDRCALLLWSRAVHAVPELDGD